ncbi:uncharacterized protein LOC116614368 [Nematostella vectensis]|uniref:uncharacterized protein LOC116614368 n=1 Tax=Nematostella vectensis TaxID=45351 RepID=UPI0013903D4F|nr:uncharacterized protein LOC116614368 [Nematostella vectensis]
MSEKLDRDHSPTSDDMQSLNITCDGLLAWRKEVDAALNSFQAKLGTLVDKVDSKGKEIDGATAYSYQYNLKITGVPQMSDKENADQTTSLCLHLFSKIGVEMDDYEIDIAHRIPTRVQHGRRGQKNKPIICKFVRRSVRERVLAARKNTSGLKSEDFGLPPDAVLGRISILRHLPPKLQELLGKAKDYQTKHGFKFCWAKSTAVFLRKTENSTVHRLESTEDLDNLSLNEPTVAEVEEQQPLPINDSYVK